MRSNRGNHCDSGHWLRRGVGGEGEAGGPMNLHQTSGVVVAFALLGLMVGAMIYRIWKLRR